MQIQDETSTLQRAYWLIPGIVCTSCLGVLLVVAYAAPLPLRAALVLWFLGACPGLAYVPLLRINDRLGAITLTIIVSLVIDTMLAGLMLYSGNWNPWWTLVCLVGMCVVGSVLQLVRRVEHPFR